MANINYEYLEKVLEEAFICVMRCLSEKTDLSSIYALGGYTNEEMSYLNFTANSLLNSTDIQHRWSPPDWQYHCYAQICFASVEEELMKGWNTDFTTYDIDKSRLFSLYITVLKKLRDSFFANTNTLVGLFMGGMGNTLVQESIRAINPESVVQTFDTDTRNKLLQ